MLTFYASNDKPTNTESLNFIQEQKGDTLDLEKKIEQYLSENPDEDRKLEEDEREYFDNLNFKQKAKYKKRRWPGHSYGKRLLVHVGFLLQSYHIAFGWAGKKINPSRATLAKEIGISIRTLDKALKILKKMGVVSWVSGKKTWETNLYTIAEAYRTNPMSRPEDFTIPKKLWLKMQYMLKKQRFKALWSTIYEHILEDIAQHTLRVNKFIRTSLEKRGRTAVKSSKDPPKERKIPPNWQLLQQFNLSFKDQWVIGRYSEALLRPAIDDLNYYREQGKKILNLPAFLTSRCKAHREKFQLLKKEKRTDIKEWIASYLQAHKRRFNFIGDISEIDRRAADLKPFIDLKIHKEDIKRSVLHVCQNVCGSWIDRMFTFDRPDFVDAVESYLERSVKQGQYSS